MMNRRNRLCWAVALVVAIGAHGQQPPKQEVRGAPLGAAPAQKSDGSQPNRVIPQTSLDLVKQVEEAAKSGRDVFDFGKTPDGKYLKLTFDALSNYAFMEPDAEALRKEADPAGSLQPQIPEPIAKLSGKPSVVVGFMVPIEINNKGEVTTFALTQNQAFCCFGIPPALNELVLVECKDGKGVQYYNDLPVAAYGKFEVGADVDDGYILSLYRIAAEEVIDIHKFLERTGKGAGGR